MMQEHVKNSVQNFFHETLSVRCENYEKFPVLKVYCARITLSFEKERYHYTLSMRDETLQMISQVLLYEDNPDEDIKIDLICECANLIIGSAKVAIEEANGGILLQLSPPEYQGYFEGEFSKDFDEKLYFKVKDSFFRIGIEKEEITIEA